MRITVASGDKQVHVKVKGNGRKKLARAEQAARRLLDAAPMPPTKAPFGFHVGSDTELAEES